MPITSHQIGGMIAGQQSMFGNFASYSQQITPGGAQGPTPTYSNPMKGSGRAMAPPPPPNADPMTSNIGTQAISAVGNIGMPALGTAAMIGGMALPGRMGRAMGAFDPFSAGLGGFAQGAGLRSGGAGIMSNMGRIASGGLGSMARAGMGGLAGGMMAAAPVMALGAAAQYGVGQMAQGAQFQNQVHGYMQNQFRQVNPASQTGFGFSREQTGKISGMIREMGHQDMMSSPQELLRVMKQGVGMGVFRAVQDAKEFKKRFKDMVSTLKEVSKTMNTTLEGAVPFLRESKKMGFWTPQDVQRSATAASQTASTTGMSVAQTQQMMAQGAAMARRIGAPGAQGAMGMVKTMNLVGGALRSGTISEGQLSEATGGLQGPDAIRAMSGTLQAATTRFASSRKARWVLAAAGGKGFKSLDTGFLGRMAMGGVGLGEISRRARKNISKQGAYNFVLNEENLRGEIVRQGPAAQLGFIRAIAGKYLNDDSSKGKLITRRLMRQYGGVGGKKADMLSKMAREAPQILEQNEARTAAGLDQVERQREEMMDRSWEGFKRKASQWWDMNLKEPMQKMGADVSRKVGGFWEKMSNKFWGKAPRQFRLSGMSGGAIRAMQSAALGDTGAMKRAFASKGEVSKALGGDPASSYIGSLNRFQGQKGVGNLLANRGMRDPTAPGVFGGVQDRLLRTGGGAGAAILAMTGFGRGGGELSNKRIESLRKLGVQEYMYKTDAARQKAVKGGDIVSGAIRGGGLYAFRGMSRKEISKTMLQSSAATGQITKETAAAIGYSSKKDAVAALQSAREGMKKGGFLRRAVQNQTEAGPEATGLALARRMVSQIRAQKVNVAPAVSRLVAAGDEKQAAFRLMAAQTESTRKGTGMDVSGDRGGATGLGAGPLGYGPEVGRKIAKGMGQAAWKLAHQVTQQQHGGWIKGASDPIQGYMRRRAGEKIKGTYQKTIMGLMNNEGPVGAKFKQAMSLLGSSKKEDQARGKKILGDLGSEEGVTDEQKKVLTSLSVEGPTSKGMRDTFKQMANLDKVKNTLGTREAMQRRANRLTISLGERTEEVVEAMNSISGKAEGDTKLGDELRESLEGKDSPGKEKDRLMRTTRAAAGADKDQVQRTLALLEGVKGAESMRGALRGGARAKLLGQQLGKGRKGRGEAAGTFSDIFSVVGEGRRVSKQDLTALQKGGKAGDKVRDRLLKGVDKDAKKWATEMVDAMKNPSANLAKIHDLSVKGGAARAIGLMGSPEKTMKGRDAASKKVMEGEVGQIQGRLGSSSGMHQELTRHTQILASIRDATEGAAKVVGNKEQTSGGKEKE